MKEDLKIERYKCPECGFMYDTKTGDDKAGISPNTEFEALPDNWKCPLCGNPKNEFYRV
jgi:rubredoxin